MSSTTSDEITADFAKMEMELKLSNSRNRELELENKLVQAELREHKVMGMQNELMEKIAKMEKEMKQQQKEEKKGEEPKENESCDKNGQLEQQKQLDDLEPKKKTNDGVLLTEIDEKLCQAEVKEREAVDRANDMKARLAKTDQKWKKTEEEEKEKEKKKRENVLHNWWDVKACHGDLEISGSQHLDVHYKRNGPRSVLAAHPISRTNSDTFYFEIKVEKMNNYMKFGLGPKTMALDQDHGLYGQSTYTYSSGGYLFYNTSGTREGIPKFSAGDVVGCGVNLTNRLIFFTKNGQRFGNTDDLTIPQSLSINALFPFVSLLDADDIIVANFGTRFNFDLGTL